MPDVIPGCASPAVQLDPSQRELCLGTLLKTQLIAHAQDWAVPRGSRVCNKRTGALFPGQICLLLVAGYRECSLVGPPPANIEVSNGAHDRPLTTVSQDHN